MSTFPGATPSFAGFTPSHTLSTDNHASQHNSEQAEIIAEANKIGTGASTPTSGMLLRGNGVGTSAWGQVVLTSDVSGVLPQANGGTGTTSSTGSGAAVYQTSPSLTTPTIASFANANHDHSNSAGGGLLSATAFANNAITAALLSTSAIYLGSTSLITSSGALSTSLTDVDISGFTLTLTVPAGGRTLLLLVIGGDYEQSGGIGTTYGVIKLKEGATVLSSTNVTPATANLPNGFCFAAIAVAASAGSHTYKVAVANNATGPNFVVGASATSPNLLIGVLL